METEHEEEHVIDEEEQIPETLFSPLDEEEMEPVAIVDDIPFPSPSLRRVIPERIRKIEKQNGIHVLPEVFKTDIDPEDIPRIKHTAPQKYIEILGELTGCSKYTSSLAEYWFLDTLANLLRRGQDDNLDKQAQAVLIQWFCQWMREMEYFDAASRERMLRRFKDNMLSAAHFIGEESRIPVPLEAGVNHKEFDEETIQRKQTMLKKNNRQLSDLTNDSKMISFEDSMYECSLRDLMKILHYIFDLFSTDYQYDLIRSVFTFPPEHCLIDAPYQIQNPRKMYTVLKPTKGSPKKREEKSSKASKSKEKEKEVETQEYINLMMLKAYDMQQQQEQEQRDREEWNLRSHILPLSFAVTSEIFDKYWPPPIPEPEPEPEIPPTPVKKPKGGKKK
ncbi:uncharacterized protein LOC113232526 [Hyposmocoma kahamanoa]|uniref:uncharacterized protein LOC113232526 n=1 Tax=Hyposmocoma kahamanoa TaxID=1477025 RepID=UPI000E6D6B7A|nr:uncharacterized protein LOC113232526 [Hyposmocoma kahamanoa]